MDDNKIPPLPAPSKSLTISGNNKYELQRQEKINEQNQELIRFKEGIAVNNSLISKHAATLTPAIAMKNSPQLSVVKKEVGEKQTGMMIMSLLNEAGKLIGKDMDAVIQGFCAETIMQDYDVLRYDEIILVLRNGANNRYGETSWGGLSHHAVQGWFKKYFIERDEEIYKQHEINKNSWGSNADRTQSDKSLGEIIDDKLWKNKIKRESHK